MRASLAAPGGRLDSQIKPFVHLLPRVVSGGFLAAHGWPKRPAGVGAVAGGPARRGIEPALPLAWVVVSLGPSAGCWSPWAR